MLQITALQQTRSNQHKTLWNWNFSDFLHVFFLGSCWLEPEHPSAQGSHSKALHQGTNMGQNFWWFFLRFRGPRTCASKIRNNQQRWRGRFSFLCTFSPLASSDKGLLLYMLYIINLESFSISFHWWSLSLSYFRIGKRSTNKYFSSSNLFLCRRSETEVLRSRLRFQISHRKSFLGNAHKKI